jgi:phospholipase C
MGAAAGLYAPGLRRALALPAMCSGRLEDIEHVVFFVQENRAFDHYFGSHRGVRGFADPHPPRLTDGTGLPVFAQPGYPAPGYGGHLYPFHLDVTADGECVHDITHEWGPQHRSWNGGRMDGFVREHLADEGNNGPVTMGYYTRADLPYYYALADAFTICDGYHCSVIGPSDPNHVHIVSATLDPDGHHGGPLITNRSQNAQVSWTTMPEQLRARGISWKVYSGADAANDTVTTDSPFPIFAQYWSDPDLHARGVATTFPGDFMHDVAAGELPQVSWIYAPIQYSEHPPFSVLWGQDTTDGILKALTSDPALWAKTVLFVTWDENGAFFDHVPPVTAPPGTPGEYLTVNPLPSIADGMSGPIGLGLRVALLIVSPFSSGGFVCSERFDHTSLLRFLETRFGVEVPNLSAWRRSVTGDLTGAFNFAAQPDASLPRLPATSQTPESADCAAELTEKVTGLPVAPVYPVPPNRMPGQEPGAPRRPSGCAKPTLRVAVDPHTITVGRRVRLRVRATAAGRPVSGALVRIGAKRARTSAHGRATITIRAHRAGLIRVIVTAVGYPRATALIRARRHRAK